MSFVKTTSAGKLIFPKEIPKDRNNYANYYSAIISSVLFTISTFVYGFSSTVYCSSLCIVILFIIECLRRILHGIEEYLYHFTSRYYNDVHNLLDKVSFEKRSTVIAFIAFAITYHLNNNNQLDIWQLAIVGTIIGLISPHFHFGKCSLSTSLSIKDLMGLDYGSGMAHSYFYGYLKITLSPEIGLVNLMKDYESKHGVVFHQYKLYILIPLSFHCQHSLDVNVSTKIENAPNLESIHKNRAGVKHRNYKNSVYKINYVINGTPHKLYIPVEYASPLTTFKEVINSNTFSAAYYTRHKEDILFNFYSSLKRLIQEDPEINNVCEIVYYNDQDKNGKLIDVGDMLLQKLILDEKRKSSN